MNVLLVDQFSDIGGAQQCILDILPAMQANGWRLQAALPGDGNYAARLKSAGVEVHDLACGPYRSGKKSLTDVLRFVTDFRKQCQAISRLVTSKGIDLVYVNGPRPLPAVAFMALRRIPVVFHAHNYIGRGRTLALAGRSVQMCAASVIACCEFIAEPLREYVPGDRVRVVRNGSADMRIADRPRNRPGALRVGMIGRIEPQKGQLEFLRSVALLASEGIELQSVICGSETSQGEAYGTEVRRLGKTLKTCFLGWSDDIATVLNGLDLLVIASQTEGFPRVMIEAFSAGVPVIAFPVGGIGEAIQDEITGFLVNPNSASALAIRIRSLAQRPGDLAKVAANARRLWEQEYNLSRYRDRMIEALAWAAVSR